MLPVPAGAWEPWLDGQSRPCLDAQLLCLKAKQALLQVSWQAVSLHAITLKSKLI